MKKISLVFLITIFAVAFSFAQNVAINATGSLPDNSAMLDVSSTTKGFLPPRMTLSQRNSIPQPATGIIIYQTDNVTGLYCNKGIAAVPDWQLIGPAAPVAFQCFFFCTDQSVSNNFIGLGSSGSDFRRYTIVVPVACVLKSIAVSTRGFNSPFTTATVWRQTPGSNSPAATTLSALIPPDTFFSVASGTVAVNAGDLLSVEIRAGSGLFLGVAVSVTYQ